MPAVPASLIPIIHMNAWRSAAVGFEREQSNRGYSRHNRLLRYLGRYVTDGIVTNVVWLGRNYKKDFTNEFASLRAQGAFHKTYAP